MPGRQAAGVDLGLPRVEVVAPALGGGEPVEHLGAGLVDGSPTGRWPRTSWRRRSRRTWRRAAEFCSGWVTFTRASTLFWGAAWKPPGGVERPRNVVLSPSSVTKPTGTALLEHALDGVDDLLDRQLHVLGAHVAGTIPRLLGHRDGRQLVVGCEPELPPREQRAVVGVVGGAAGQERERLVGGVVGLDLLELTEQPRSLRRVAHEVDRRGHPRRRAGVRGGLGSAPRRGDCSLVGRRTSRGLSFGSWADGSSSPPQPASTTSESGSTASRAASRVRARGVMGAIL